MLINLFLTCTLVPQADFSTHNFVSINIALRVQQFLIVFIKNKGTKMIFLGGGGGVEGVRDNAVVRALASHRCGLGLIPALGCHDYVS